MKIRWKIEAKLNLKDRCPSCRKALNDSDIIKKGGVNGWLYCKFCDEEITNYIYYKKNLRMFGSPHKS